MIHINFAMSRPVRYSWKFSVDAEVKFVSTLRDQGGGFILGFYVIDEAHARLSPQNRVLD